MPICKKCGNKFRTVAIVKGIKVCLSGRQYCLECSPYKQFLISKTMKRPSNNTIDGKRKCSMCKKILELSCFGKVSQGKWYHIWCKSCKAIYNRLCSQSFKKLCIEYKGGACQRCGYNKCIAALDFHHRDRNTKLFALSRKNSYEFNQQIKDELDKCDILCANCHRELEFSLINSSPDSVELLKYTSA